jgi:hypothetical protein
VSVAAVASDTENQVRVNRPLEIRLSFEPTI